MTQEQFSELRTSFERGIAEIRKDIKDARVEAQEGHNRLRTDLQETSNLCREHEFRLNKIDDDVIADEKAKQAELDARRYFWPQVIAVAALSAGLFMWVADKLIAMKAHP